MMEKYGADRDTWPVYDSDLWYSTGIDDQNVHGDNYGLGALGKTRGMFRSGGSSGSQSHSSQSYSSMPLAQHLTEEDIDRISSQVIDQMEARLVDQMEALVEARLEARMEALLKARMEARFRASRAGGSGSHQASPPAPQDDEDDDEGQFSDVDGDGTA